MITRTFLSFFRLTVPGGGSRADTNTFPQMPHQDDTTTVKPKKSWGRGAKSGSYANGVLKSGELPDFNHVRKHGGPERFHQKGLFEAHPSKNGR